MAARKFSGRGGGAIADDSAPNDWRNSSWWSDKRRALSLSPPPKTDERGHRSGGLGPLAWRPMLSPRPIFKTQVSDILRESSPKPSLSPPGESLSPLSPPGGSPRSAFDGCVIDVPQLASCIDGFCWVASSLAAAYRSRNRFGPEIRVVVAPPREPAPDKKLTAHVVAVGSAGAESRSASAAAPTALRSTPPTAAANADLRVVPGVVPVPGVSQSSPPPRTVPAAAVGQGRQELQLERRTQQVARPAAQAAAPRTAAFREAPRPRLPIVPEAPRSPRPLVPEAHKQTRETKREAKQSDEADEADEVDGADGAGEREAADAADAVDGSETDDDEGADGAGLKRKQEQRREEEEEEMEDGFALILCRGLPGSGKRTLVNAEVEGRRAANRAVNEERGFASKKQDALQRDCLFTPSVKDMEHLAKEVDRQMRALTKAKRFKGMPRLAAVFASSDLHTNDEGDYAFDPENAIDVHERVIDRVRNCMALRKFTRVYVSNSFTRLWEMRTLVQLARKFGYRVEFRTTPLRDLDECFRRSALTKHHVSMRDLEAMDDEFEERGAGAFMVRLVHASVPPVVRTITRP